MHCFDYCFFFLKSTSKRRGGGLQMRSLLSSPSSLLAEEGRAAGQEGLGPNQITELKLHGTLAWGRGGKSAGRGRGIAFSSFLSIPGFIFCLKSSLEENRSKKKKNKSSFPAGGKRIVCATHKSSSPAFVTFSKGFHRLFCVQAVETSHTFYGHKALKKKGVSRGWVGREVAFIFQPSG